VSNGRVEDSFDARIHYSGAINGGMSGGPALNGAGKVIGINVSGYRFEQLVSFLVPAEHAKALIDKALKSPFNGRDAKKEVATQLRAHAGKLLQALDGKLVTENAAGYELPAKLKPFIACNAAGDPSSDQPVQTERINCSAKAGLYVQQGMYSGDLKYSHYVMTTDKLDSWRFAQRLGSLSQAAGSFGSRKHVGPFACKNDAVKLQGFDASLLVCTRSYRKFEGLYDITVRVVSLNQPKKGFASHLDMYGVDYDAGMAFVKRYVEAMRWKP
jgi:serine protease Do